MLFKDRVKETTTTTGTGNLTTAGAATGFITFNTAFGTGSSNTFQYVIDSPTGSEWEVGVGYMSASTTLVRSTVLASSNSGAAVNFSAGTKYIRATIAAAALTQNVEALLATATLLADDNGTAQSVYTVPTGKRLIATKLVFRDESTDITGGTPTFDVLYDTNSITPWNTGIVDFSDWTGSKTHFKPLVLSIGASFRIGVAGEVLKVKFGNSGLAGTETIICDLWGYLYNA